VTVRRAVAALSMVFTAAVRDEIIPANPAKFADKPAVAKGPVEVWEPHQVVEFFERCGRHRLGAVFELAVFTGPRRGELAGLRWSEIDLDARTIVVRHNRVSVTDGCRSRPPKPAQDAVQSR
jgi:integrase